VAPTWDFSRKRFLVSGFWFLVSGFWFLVSGFWFLVSSFWFWFFGSTSPCDIQRKSNQNQKLETSI
jgi:hypothetical protein